MSRRGLSTTFCLARLNISEHTHRTPRQSGRTLRLPITVGLTNYHHLPGERSATLTQSAYSRVARTNGEYRGSYARLADSLPYGNVHGNPTLWTQLHNFLGWRNFSGKPISRTYYF